MVFAHVVLLEEEIYHYIDKKNYYVLNYNSKNIKNWPEQKPIIFLARLGSRDQRPRVPHDVADQGQPEGFKPSTLIINVASIRPTRAG